MVSEQDLAALEGFVEETNESLQDIENAFIELESDPGNLEIITRIFRPVHSMKGNSGFFGLTHMNRFAHRLEDLLDYIRRGEILVDGEIIDILLTGVEYLQGMLDRIFDDLEDVSLRPEEEKFLVERVESCQPSKAGGNLQSLIELEELLQQLDQFTFDPMQDSVVNDTLSHVAKCVQHLQSKLDQQQQEQEPLFDLGASYHYQDEDLTDTVQALAAGLETLEQGVPLQGDQLKQVEASLGQLFSSCAAEQGLAAIKDELEPLIAFMDDALMASSAEFFSSVSEQVRALLALMTVTGGQQEDEVKKLGEILLEQGKVAPEQLDQALAKQPKVGEILVEEGAISSEDLQQALANQDKQSLNKHVATKAKEKKVSKTIRIDQSKLDSFADTVGDLFIALDSFNFLRRQLEASSLSGDIITRFSNTITTMDDMVAHLQEDIMSVRKVPVQGLFKRFPKVIRQLSASLDKKINLVIKGEETVIDKDLLEDIENPLVHILRNSVDHGIESCGVREQAGKSASGTLTLAAEVDDQYVYLVIEDDGGGINPETIKKVAVNKGFMAEEEVNRLSEKELVNLIFKPGFSSAEQISDVSGRGVGMDVVMSALQKNSGTIDVDSQVGHGTKVTITIPLTRTLVTSEALIVKSSDQYFAIPSSLITTTIYPEDNFLNIMDSRNGLAYNNAIMRVVDINDFFYHQPAPDTLSTEHVLVVCAEQQLALLVDEIFNHQQIVVKVFGKGYRQLQNIPGIYGYTVLGNEDIVLIIDVEKMALEPNC